MPRRKNRWDVNERERGRPERARHNKAPQKKTHAQPPGT